MITYYYTEICNEFYNNSFNNYNYYSTILEIKIPEAQSGYGTFQESIHKFEAELKIQKCAHMFMGSLFSPFSLGDALKDIFQV